MLLSTSKEGRTSMTSKRGALVLICILAGLGVLALLATLLSGAGYDVQGDAVMPYESGTVKEVRLLGAFTVYVDAESQPTPGILGGLALLILATAAFMTALVLHMVGGRRRLVAFYALICAGFGFAAFDELFAMHETLGHNLQFLADLPGVTRPDDVVVALYILPAAAFTYYFRDVVLGNRRAVFALAGALGFFALSVAGDVTGQTKFEAVMEVCSGLCIAAFLPLMMYSHLRGNLRPQPDVSAEVTVVDQRPQQRVPAGSAG
jgi:hypothetical protein